MRLLVFPHAFNVKFFWCALIKQLGCGFDVNFGNKQLNTAHQV